jgi:hypothetical protein
MMQYVKRFFLDVQLTAIAQPELLQHVSSILHDHRRAFRRFNVDLIPSPYTDLRIGHELFRSVLAGPRLSAHESGNLFTAMNYAADGKIDFIQVSSACHAFCDS